MSIILAKFGSSGVLAPLVSLLGNNVSNGGANPAFAGVIYRSGGDEQQCDVNGDFSLGNPRGDWLDQGNASQVWLVYSLVSGSLNWQDPGENVRQNMASNYTVGVTSTSGSRSCTLVIDAYDAASGGNLLDSVQISLTAIAS